MSGPLQVSPSKFTTRCPSCSPAKPSRPPTCFTDGSDDFRCLQQVHLDKHIKLLDCPGIVMAISTTDAAMILRNCVKIEQLVDPLAPVEAILRRCNKAQVGHLVTTIRNVA